MKVLSILKPYVDIENVGAAWVGTYLTNQLAALPEIEVGLVTALEDYSSFDERVKIYNIEGLRVRSAIKKLMENSIRIYKEDNYDVMHIHVNSLTVLRWMVELVPEDVSIVYTLHNSLILGRSKIIYGIPYASQLSNKNNVRIVAVSEFMQGIWKNFIGASPEDSIGNMSTVNLSIKEEPIERVSTNDKLDRVFMCGRITPDKEFDKALEYLGENDIETLFIGEGYVINKGRSDAKDNDYINMVEGIINKYPSIHWKSRMGHNQILQEMSRSKVTLHTSTMESYGLVPVESLYAGTPVICFEPTPSIVEKENLLEDEDAFRILRFKKHTRWPTRMRSVGEAVSHYLKEPPDSDKVYNFYSRTYGQESMLEGYLKVYQSF